jgi:hypothetical protein
VTTTKPSNKEAIQRRAATVHGAFSTADGRDALEILQEQFGGSCYAKGDPHHTAYLEGGRDVLLYIRDMMNYYEKGK